MTGGAPVAVHATAVVIREAGVLIRGPSGAGKSSLALLLIDAAGQRGWFARLVGDDRVLLHGHDGAVVATPHPAILGLVERRTQAIARVPHEPRCRVALLVDLVPPEARLPRLAPEEPAASLLPGADPLPRVRLQGPPSALLCNIVFDKLAASRCGLASLELFYLPNRSPSA